VVKRLQLARLTAQQRHKSDGDQTFARQSAGRLREFHDVLRADGTPYREREAEIIRELTGKTLAKN